MKKLVFLYAILIFIGTQTGQTQSDWEYTANGSLVGKVLDQDGESLPFAHLVLIKKVSNVPTITGSASFYEDHFSYPYWEEERTYGTSTDFDGRFYFGSVSPGEYTLRAFYIGYKTESGQILIKNGQFSMLNLSLKQSESALGAEQIVVTAYSLPSRYEPFYNKNLNFRFRIWDGRCGCVLVPDKAKRKKRRPKRKQKRQNLESEEEKAIESPTQNRLIENPFLLCRRFPNSTFSMDVENTAYINIHQEIERNRSPSQSSIRLEEIINYFDYNYPQPKENQPIGITTELGNCPWNENSKLVQIGLQAKNGDSSILAKKVKTKVRFNKNLVVAHRLIGYENHNLDENNFKKFKGKEKKKGIRELVSGHNVTALYEIQLRKKRFKNINSTKKIMRLKITYQQPLSKKKTSNKQVVTYNAQQLQESSDNFRLAAAAAGWGLLLRRSDYNTSLTYSQLLKLANSASDGQADREEFIELIQVQNSLNLESQH